MSAYHIPVLLNESVDGLNIKPKGIYVDVTYGGGGHSAEILKRLTGGKLYAFDQDADAATDHPENKKFSFIHGNFRFLKNYLNYYQVERIDGLLADLGVSSHHFNTPDRGFTYRSEARLDMRVNRDSGVTAEMIINEYDVRQLTEVFRKYGELQQARKLASAITLARAKQRIETSEGLVDCIARLVPKQNENQFLSRVFQAIRIEVNRELENLKDLLYSSGEMLNSGGRLVIISYHSLEDRLVKNFMRWGNTVESPEKDLFGNAPRPFNIITRKPVIAGENEVAANPRARSALLRIAEKN